MTKKPIVNSNCIGCGACVAICPNSFELNEEGMSEVIDNETHDESCVNDAISACPVDAISWEEK